MKSQINEVVWRIQKPQELTVEYENTERLFNEVIEIQQNIKSIYVNKYIFIFF